MMTAERARQSARRSIFEGGSSPEKKNTLQRPPRHQMARRSRVEVRLCNLPWRCFRRINSNRKEKRRGAREVAR